MPELQGREDQHQAWKRSVLSGETILTDIDTDPFNFERGRRPTQPSTKATHDMVAGVVGRPGSEAVN